MEFFNLTKMKLAKRLGLSFGSLTLWAVAIGAVAWWGLATVNTAMDETLAENADTSIAQDITKDIDDVLLNVWNILAHDSVAEKDEHRRALTVVRDTYRKKVEELKSHIPEPEGQRLLAEFEESLVGLRQINDQVIDLSVKGKKAEALALFAEKGQIADADVDQHLTAVISWHKARVKEADDRANATYNRTRTILGVLIALALVSASLFGFVITRSISGPITQSVAVLTKLSQGDLSQDVAADLRSRADEAGMLGRAIQATIDSLRDSLQRLAAGVDTLTSSSTQLSSVAGQSSSGARSMAERTNTVAAAAEEASANTLSVASSMEEATSNLSSVAAATEEMSATVAEIATNAERARGISERATGQAQAVSTMMQQLGQAAREIGKVTDTITDISSQTNLLALNATIEAARAGAAGKGFAVVANEIKELARQTATATEDIKAQIAGIQGSTGSAISDIEAIAGVIEEVGRIVATIAAAIEEQAAVTKDVAQNIAHASSGVQDANDRVAQTASVSKSIAEDIAGVSSSVAEVRQGGEQVFASSAELSTLAEQLSEIVQRFRGVDLRKSKAGADQSVMLAWRDEWATGIPNMDAQHRQLINLINRLHSALKRGEGAAATEAVLKELLQYTEYHFAAEEELMAHANYSGLAAQKDAHQKLVAKAKDAARRWASGDTGVTGELMDMLTNWLPQHIVKMDKSYGPYIKAA
jgi:methyl-accepting chemotaxis protein